MKPQLAACHILGTYLPVVGGVQRATAALCAELGTLGVDVCVVTRWSAGLARRELIDGVRVHRAGVGPVPLVGTLLFILHAFWLLLARHRKYRVLHVQSIDAPLIIGLLGKTLLRRRLVATIHGEAKLLMKRRSLAGRARIALMRRYTDAFCALSDPVRTELVALGVPDRRIHSVPNGIDAQQFRPPRSEERQHARHDLRIHPDAAVVVFVGRLIQLKRVDLLIRAWAAQGVEEGCLLIVGDGPQRSSLELLARELRLDNVRFVGATSDVRSCLWAADVFALLSEREGLSVALLEAMACGLPVLVSDVAGNRSVVGPTYSAPALPIGELEPVIAQLASFLSSPTQRERCGSDALRRVQQEFSLHAVSLAHRNLYADLIAPALPAPSTSPYAATQCEP